MDRIAHVGGPGVRIGIAWPRSREGSDLRELTRLLSRNQGPTKAALRVLTPSSVGKPMQSRRSSHVRNMGGPAIDNMLTRPDARAWSSQRVWSGGIGAAGAYMIQWSVIFMPRVTSRRGMWQAMQPERGEVGQGVRDGPEWHLRQAAS